MCWYICLDCGHRFEQGEEKSWFEPYGLGDGSGEQFIGCPICGGAFESAVECDICGGQFLPDSVYDNHYCIDCLRASINITTGLAYMEDRNQLVDFMFNEVWGCDPPKWASDALKQHLHEQYSRCAMDDVILKDNNFINKVKAWILEYDGGCGAEDYADWLYGWKSRNGRADHGHKITEVE